MILLHICYINNNRANGISNVVPEHFINQSKYNKNVGILNCNELIIEKIKNYQNSFNINDLEKYDISSLKEPFNNPNLVIFHDLYIPIYIKIYKKLKQHCIPYIIIPHGSLSFEAQKQKFFKKKFANFLLFNKFIKNSIYLQFLSEDERNKSKKIIHRSFVLGNGVDEYSWEKTKFNIDNIKLLYIGRYSIHTKGIDILLESCFKNKKYMELNNITLDMFGANTRAENGFCYIDKYIKNHGLEKIIKLHGSIFDEEKFKQYVCHDFFIQMSRHEGQPLGIMEAMMVGLPIIASEGTTFGDIIKVNSCGYKCSTSKEFSKVIQMAVENKKRLKHMSKNSLKYAKNNFSWNIIAKKTLDKYSSIINER